MSELRARPIISRSEITNPKLAQLFDYWSSKRAARFAPARSDIDPIDIPRLLPWVWLVDVIDGGNDFRGRLGGEKLVHFLGRQVTGKTLGAHSSNPFFAKVAKAFSVVVANKQPLLRPAGPTNYAHKDIVETEVLLLPLSDNGTDVTQIFGGFATMTPLTRALDLEAAQG